MDLTKRHESGIYALKILEIKEDGKAVVKHPLKEKACVLVPIPSSECYGVGMYVDVQFFPNDEFMLKYKAVYRRITSPEFVPGDDAEIY